MGVRAAGERLYRAHDHVRKVRDRKVTEALTEELAGCTFRPQLRARSARRGGGAGSGRVHVPLQKRAGDLVKQRNERIAQCGSMCFRICVHVCVWGTCAASDDGHWSYAS